MTKSISQAVIRFCDNEKIVTNTVGLAEIYEVVLLQFSKVHEIISHKKPLSQDDIAELKIKEYIKMFRRKYANVNLIPKQHLLEFHCIDWLKRFGFGMAFHGEQGGGGGNVYMLILKNQAILYRYFKRRR